MVYSSGPETLAKPRILCLHGGGVSARIFRLQARGLVRRLAPHFRLVFADGPFRSEMHPDLQPVYNRMGPCRQWVGWSAPTQDALDYSHRESAVDAIEASLKATIAADPGSGEWVGVLGFSQGARLVASILLENQLRLEDTDTNIASDERAAHGPFTGVHWKFGVLMAGGGPPYALSRRTLHCRASSESPWAWRCSAPEQIEAAGRITKREMSGREQFPDRLRTPTVHVHGLQDEGLVVHRQLLHEYMACDRTLLVEWNGKHRIPIRTVDVEAVARAILQAAELAARDNLDSLPLRRIKC